MLFILLPSPALSASFSLLAALILPFVTRAFFSVKQPTVLNDRVEKAERTGARGMPREGGGQGVQVGKGRIGRESERGMKKRKRGNG